jgi:hypothetical protein
MHFLLQPLCVVASYNAPTALHHRVPALVCEGGLGAGHQSSIAVNQGLFLHNFLHHLFIRNPRGKRAKDDSVTLDAFGPSF